MNPFKIAGFLISIQSFFFNLTFPAKDQGFERGKMEYRIRKVGRLSPSLMESSGLENYNGNLITLTDSGNPSKLYTLNSKAQIIDTISFNLINRDWETMATDTSGSIYIGDIGNNANRRKNLLIYKISNAHADSISIVYGDQKRFPPNPDNKNFDCEAMFWQGGYLHLFSKNRGKKWVKYYRVSDVPGSYVLNPIDSIILERQITAADYDPLKNKTMLLGYGIIYTFDSIGIKYPDKAIRFSRSGQSEGLIIKNDTTFISNESGKLFRVTQTTNQQRRSQKR